MEKSEEESSAPKPPKTTKSDDTQKVSFSIKDEEKKSSYTLTFSTESDSLLIDIVEDNTLPSIHYIEKFSLNDLVKQSRYFKLFEKAEDFIPELKDLFDQNKINLKKEKNEVLLFLSLPMKTLENAALCIPQGEIDSKTVITDLCSTVNELRKDIELLKTDTIPEEVLAKNLESQEIFMNEEEKKMVSDWILKQMKSEGKKIEMKLLYRLKRDNNSASTFHSLCNNKGATLSLIRNTNGFRCGGFISKSWTSCGSYVHDTNAFLFSLDYKEKYCINKDGTNAFNDNSGYGPTFGGGHDLYIANGCSGSTSNYCNFPYSYTGVKQRALSGGLYNFKVDEIEVYQICFS